MAIVVILLGKKRKVGRPVSFTTAQKAPVRVIDPATGATLAASAFGPYISIVGPGALEVGADAVFVVPKVDPVTGNVLTGNATVTVRLPDGRSGTCMATINAAPLVVELGEAVPR